MNESTCDSCGAKIYWVLTEKGRRMPIDAEPELLRGKFLIDEIFTGTPVARSVGTVYVSHFATCPNAAQHRR